MSNRGGREAPSSTTLECCMCGDYGLPEELFRCKICLFRFQHRYCSNLYPKAESYRVCNWCLKRKGRKIIDGGAHNSSSSLSSENNNSERREEGRNKNNIKSNRGEDHVLLGVKAQRGNLQLHLQSPMKKQRSPDRSSMARKRINPSGCLEKTLRRTKSEEIQKSGIIKQVFRGKVRRYKLLEEFSS